MSYRVAPPPPQPPSRRVSVALLANLAGLLLLVAGVTGLIVVAFAFDTRTGWALSSLTAIGAGWLLTRLTDEA